MVVMAAAPKTSSNGIGKVGKTAEITEIRAAQADKTDMVIAARVAAHAAANVTILLGKVTILGEDTRRHRVFVVMNTAYTTGADTVCVSHLAVNTGRMLTVIMS